MNKFTLHLQNGRSVELPAGRIAVTGSDCDCRFPWEPHPYDVRLFVIGNEYGALGCEGVCV